MWFHNDFLLRFGVNRGMRTIVPLTRMALPAYNLHKIK
jgi:hypothetical protein